MTRLPILFLTAATIAAPYTCTPVEPTPTQAWREADAVFLDVVTRLSPYLITGQFNPGQTVHLEVLEPFKGVQRHQMLRLETGPGGYRIGDRILFYLFRSPVHPSSWYVPPCHRFRHESGAADDLLFLRALPASATRSRIAGTVSRSDPYQAIPNLRVSVRGPTRKIDTTTNADGVYEIYDLPPGSYTVKVHIPKGLKLHTIRRQGQLPFVGDKRNQLRLRPANTTAGLDFVLN